MPIQYFFYLCISFAITAGITPIVISLAQKFGLVDDKSKRPHPAQTHKGIIPRAGGLAIFLGIVIPIFFVVPITQGVVGILLGLTLLMIVGLWDDKRDRSPYLRFITNCCAGLIVIFSGIGISYITSPLGGVIRFDQLTVLIHFLGEHSIVVIADILALGWIVWTLNIVGWSGGVDGQLPGFVGISAIIIGLLSLRFLTNDPTLGTVTALSFITAGAFIGFLPWNFYPQKIMPGYGGKTIAGFMLAVLSILSSAKLGTALLVLTIPMIDAGFIFFRRIVSGKSPVWASSGHLHHHLLKRGWGKRRIAIFYWFISATTGIIALSVNPTQKIFAGIVVGVLVLGFIVWVNFARQKIKIS